MVLSPSYAFNPNELRNSTSESGTSLINKDEALILFANALVAE